MFFQKFAGGVENLAKTASFYCFGRARKMNLVDLKKRVVKIFVFENLLPPPLEKILDKPDLNFSEIFPPFWYCCTSALLSAPDKTNIFSDLYWEKNVTQSMLSALRTCELHKI